jgi:hypothetical protein
MCSLTELDADALRVARDSAETLMSFKAYFPPGGLLLMVLGRFRDDIADALGDGIDAEDKPRALPRRGREHLSLDQLTSVELGTVSGAVMILLQDRFRSVMDDPELPRQLAGFQDKLTGQKTERAEIRKSMAS